jgi:hypothetical protein
MKKTLLLLFSILQFSILGYAQITFERTYGGLKDDWANEVQPTYDNGYICVGSTLSFGIGGYDVYLVKLNELGDTVWTKTIGGFGKDVGYSIKQTSDSGFIIVGETDSIGMGSSHTDLYLIKTSSTGDSLWTKKIIGTVYNIGFSVIQTFDGGFAISGSKSYFPGTFGDVLLLKTDPNGNTVFEKNYGGNYQDYGRYIEQTSDSGYVITGSFAKTEVGNEEVYLIRTDKNGDTLWTKTYGGEYDDLGYSFVKTDDGGYIITGITDRFFGGTNDGIFLVRTNAMGDTIWTKSYGGIDDLSGLSITKSIDSGYLISGGIYSLYTDWDLLLLKINKNGDSLWTRTYGGTNEDYGRCIKTTTDGGYIIAGMINNCFGIANSDVYLIKTDANGIVGINENLLTPNSNFTLSPNPFSHSTRISLGQTYKDIALEVYNLQGQRVAENHYAACREITLQRNGLRQGMYFLKLTLDGRMVETRKMMISD